MKKDRLDIAHVIYEWWKTRKDKEDYLNATITVEQYLQIDRINPEIEFEEIGSKIYVKYKEKPDEIIYSHPGDSKEIRKALSSCSTCDHEIYYHNDEGATWHSKENWLWFRDCLNLSQQAIDHFNNIVRNKTDKGYIQPVYDCPFWKQRIKELNI